MNNLEMSEKIIHAQAVGYSMALRKVIAWIKSGETLEQFFETKHPENDLSWEWNELNKELLEIKKRK